MGEVEDGEEECGGVGGGKRGERRYKRVRAKREDKRICNRDITMEDLEVMLPPFTCSHLPELKHNGKKGL